MPVALKEWAVTVRALSEGDQLITFRKGGVREQNRHFEIAYPRFMLYPTFDHQRGGLVRESHRPELRRALEDASWDGGTPPADALVGNAAIPQPRTVKIRAWTEVAAAYETDCPRTVEQLSPYHVWTRDYATKRLNWKPRHPLHILLLRVHRLPRPITVPVTDEYGGCRSWIDIDREIPYAGTAVLADAEFNQARDEIEKIVQATPTVVPDTDQPGVPRP